MCSWYSLQAADMCSAVAGEGGCSVHCRVFGSIPRLYSIDDSSCPATVMIKNIPRLCRMSSGGGGAKQPTALTYQECLPQDLCICSFCLLPGTAGLTPSPGQVYFKHHLDINSPFPLSFLINLTLLYFPLFHLLLPCFSHAFTQGCPSTCRERS